MHCCERRGWRPRACCRPRPRPASPRHSRKPVQREEIDAALQAKVARREIPGVVAMAANEASVVYQGAFGVRSMAAATPMSIGHDLPHRLDGQTADVGRSTATGGARQAEAGRAGRPYRSDARLAASSRRLRCQGRSAAAAGAKADHAAQPADAHVRLQLSAVGCQRRSLSQVRARQAGICRACR